MTAYTFENFFHTFHKVTGQKKVYKAISKKLWDKTLSLELKKKAFKSISKYKGLEFNIYDVLKIELNNVK